MLVGWSLHLSGGRALLRREALNGQTENEDYKFKDGMNLCARKFNCKQTVIKLCQTVKSVSYYLQKIRIGGGAL